MNEKLSVIVPIYRVEKYLDQCISSICSQNYTKLEIILVDDGSDDSSPQICDKWASRDDRIIVIHKHNGGLVSARKTGALAATGKYITYVDGDDWIEPDMYEKMMQYEGDIIISGFTKEHSKYCEKVLNNVDAGEYRGNLLKELKDTMVCKQPFYTMAIFPNVWSKIFLREKFMSYQLEVDDKISMGEDFVVTFPYMINCDIVILTNNTSYHYRINPNGMTGSRDINYLKKCEPLFDYIFDKIYGKNEQLDEQINMYIAHMLLNGIGILLDIRSKMRIQDKIKNIQQIFRMPKVNEILNKKNKLGMHKIQRIILESAQKNKYLICIIAVHINLLREKIASKMK